MSGDQPEPSKAATASGTITAVAEQVTDRAPWMLSADEERAFAQRFVEIQERADRDLSQTIQNDLRIRLARLAPTGRN